MKHKASKRLTELMLRYHNTCQYCNCLVSFYPSLKGIATPPTAASIDHIVPKCAGGTNEPSNLILSCQGCNQTKVKQDITIAFLKDGGWKFKKIFGMEFIYRGKKRPKKISFLHKQSIKNYGQTIRAGA